jgi:hypothetical protein
LGAWKVLSVVVILASIGSLTVGCFSKSNEVNKVGVTLSASVNVKAGETTGTAAPDVKVSSHPNEQSASTDTGTPLVDQSTKTEAVGTIETLIPNGWHIIKINSEDLALRRGDLNKDGIPDAAVVIEENEGQSGDDPQRALLLAFGAGDNTYKLSTMSNRAVKTEHEGGPFGDPFYALAIDRGSVVLTFYGGSSSRWSYKYRFRYQNDDWYLIGATTDARDAFTAEMKEADYNLITGDYSIKLWKDGNSDPKVYNGNIGAETLIQLGEFDVNGDSSQYLTPNRVISTEAITDAFERRGMPVKSIKDGVVIVEPNKEYDVDSEYGVVYEVKNNINYPPGDPVFNVLDPIK